MRKLLLVLGISAVLFLSVGVTMAEAETTTYPSLAAFLDEQILKPHHSLISGELMVNVTGWYGVPVIAQLCILGAESSIADPRPGSQGGGGPIVTEANNFGCMRFGDRKSKWGELSEPLPYHIAGKDWFSFKTPFIGMCAWGRYIKVGPSFNSGVYLRILNAKPINWQAFADIYYGKGVAGLAAYVQNLQGMESSFRAKAHKYGFDL